MSLVDAVWSKCPETHWNPLEAHWKPTPAPARCVLTAVLPFGRSVSFTQLPKVTQPVSGITALALAQPLTQRALQTEAVSKVVLTPVNH